MDKNKKSLLIVYLKGGCNNTKPSVRFFVLSITNSTCYIWELTVYGELILNIESHVDTTLIEFYYQLIWH